MNVEPLSKSSLSLEMLILGPSEHWDEEMIGETISPCIDLELSFITLLLGY